MTKNTIIGILLILCIALVFFARNKAEYALSQRNRSIEIQQQAEDASRKADLQAEKALDAAEEATRKMAELQLAKMELQKCQEGK